MSNDILETAALDLWNRAKAIYLAMLRSEEEKAQAESYFAMTTSVASADGTFTVYTSNAFAAQFLTDKYTDKLKVAFDLAGGDKDQSLRFAFDEQSKPSIIVPVAAPVAPTPSPLTAAVQTAPIRSAPFISTLPLEENYTFEEFVPGPSNSWAYSAAMGVANNPGQKTYNPLFIHGGTGLGKTHLMQAIGNALRKKNPSMSICYLTAETFLNEYVNALQNKDKRGMESFRDKYRNIDVLLVDDIQFLQKGTMCQEEFFNTFNFLTTNHKQIVMTSDVAPKNLPALEARLISRFEGGMVQEIEAPGYETRLAILEKKAEALSPSVPESALQFLAENIKSHVRSIEGALKKVHATTVFNPTQQLTPDFLRLLLKDVIEKEQALRKLTIKEIQETVSERYGVSVPQILSTDRSQSLVTPRQLAMYISRKYTPKSLLEIAAEFKKKHATIIHGVKTIETQLDVDPELKASLEDILQQFGYKISDKME